MPAIHPRISCPPAEIIDASTHLAPQLVAPAGYWLAAMSFGLDGCVRYQARLRILAGIPGFLTLAASVAGGLIFSERHAGLGVCAWKAHGSCGLVHGVCKGRKRSFLYGVLAHSG